MLVGWTTLDLNRLAVLRAGFRYLGAEDPSAQELYAALAVLPDGYSFNMSDAVVLLDDEEVALGAMSILERWAVLGVDTTGWYRMHDAHVDFARDKLMGWEDVRKPAVDRWTSRLSRLELVLGIDVYVVLDMWRALQRVGSEGWWRTMTNLYEWTCRLSRNIEPCSLWRTCSSMLKSSSSYSRGTHATDTRALPPPRGQQCWAHEVRPLPCPSNYLAPRKRSGES